MARLWLSVCLCVLLFSEVTPLEDDDDFLYDVFPPGFQWGTATSAYQIEGGWDADGKGESIWDRFTHDGHAAQNQTGDIACNSYYQWQEDIDVLVTLEVHYYRFSLSWSRILPNGTLDGGINQPGIDYYNRLINGLLAVDIKPMVTLYHWDLPQALQDIGGWRNEALVQHYEDYARVAFQNFGDRVKKWITFNEPWVTCHLGYGTGVMAPGEIDPAEGQYVTGHVLLKAHAEAWHAYNDDFRAAQNGTIGITVNSEWREPLTDLPEDVEASMRAIDFYLGWFAHPIYSTSGDYPPRMRTAVDTKSEDQGYPESRLPYFSPAEIDRIKGTSDFFGINHYTTQYCREEIRNINCTTYFCDQDILTFKNQTWETSGSIWLRVVPWGLRKLLNWIQAEYGDWPIYITENGVSDRNVTVEDYDRIDFFDNYINEVLKAVRLDGVNVQAYIAWSLMDNFEWLSGYHERFGIHYVDFDEDPDLMRQPKLSAENYRQIIRNNGFPAPVNM